MSTAATEIAWTDRTWNPLRGCSRVSSGCDHCYAAAVAHRFDKPGLPYEGLSRKGPHGPDWSGKVVFVEKALLEPLNWRKPQRVFVNSMSDLFHPAVTDETIAAIFGVMAACPHLTFQVLTKRPERMREWFTWIACNPVSRGWAANAARGVRWYAWHHNDDLRVYDPAQPWVWPLPNVWIGVSVEDQATADERIPLLLQTPAAVRFISAEPLLGQVTLRTSWRKNPSCTFCDDAGNYMGTENLCPCGSQSTGLDWVIVGGESGPKARPCDVAWIRSIVQQCQSAGVPVFVKQLGSVIVDRNDAGLDADSHVFADGEDAGQPVNQTAWPDHIADEDRVEHDLSGSRDGYQGAPVRIRTRDRKGADPSEWPHDLRVQQFPRVAAQAASALGCAPHDLDLGAGRRPCPCCGALMTTSDGEAS